MSRVCTAFTGSANEVLNLPRYGPSMSRMAWPSSDRSADCMPLKSRVDATSSCTFVACESESRLLNLSTKVASNATLQPTMLRRLGCADSSKKRYVLDRADSKKLMSSVSMYPSKLGSISCICASSNWNTMSCPKKNILIVLRSRTLNVQSPLASPLGILSLVQSVSTRRFASGCKRRAWRSLLPDKTPLPEIEALPELPSNSFPTVVLATTNALISELAPECPAFHENVITAISTMSSSMPTSDSSSEPIKPTSPNGSPMTDVTVYGQFAPASTALTSSNDAL
mmetsp:Transcript_28250/g.41780  ORF Transcript_28250/g.41780 Transcript_28250/m.41780 type:complete len:284 (-) Transcript_28250:3148-3999(-)